MSLPQANFKRIDLNTWPRKPYFDNFYTHTPCTYSLTTNIDITEILHYKQEQHCKLYPLLIYILTKAVNQHPEFRTTFNHNQELGIWDYLIPSYTIFHKDTETFSSIYTTYTESLSEFIKNYNQDLELYASQHQPLAKANPPDNILFISAIPWTNFTSFNLNLDYGSKFLLPILTLGKYFQQEQKYYLPLAIQAHHAVCDGFHTSKLISTIEQICTNFSKISFL